jgi:predicted dehydrogenase
MKRLRIGVIGGHMGRKHIEQYREHPGSDVVALADIDPVTLKADCREYGVKGYPTAEAMFKAEALDVVSVVVPNHLHKPLTLMGFKYGCHVLCEKPMALDAAEAKQMLAAAKKAKRRLMVNFSYRFTEQAWALKQRVAAGALGDIYFGRTLWHRRRGIPGFGGWFTTKKLAGGGPLIDLGVHRLDLALWLMGYPKPVWAMAGAYSAIAGPMAKKAGKSFDVEDLACGQIRFDNGATLSVEASWAANIERQEWMDTLLLGTKAGLTQRNISSGTGFFGYDFEALLFTEKDGSQYTERLMPPVPGVMPGPAHFVDSILNKKPHIATGEEGVRVMEILDALYLSARKKAPVKMA